MTQNEVNNVFSEGYRNPAFEVSLNSFYSVEGKNAMEGFLEGEIIFFQQAKISQSPIHLQRCPTNAMGSEPKN